VPRDLPIANGSFLITFDSDYRIADVYFPHVGMENHAGTRFRFGIWEQGRFSWFDEAHWRKELRYLNDTLVTDVTCESPAWGLRLRCYDTVDSESNVYVRKIVVRNLESRRRSIKLFFHHDFHLYGNAIGDTALFDPESGSIIHYKATRYFLINAATDTRTGVTEYACGNSKAGGQEGTWRDAEDGALSMNPIAQGAVDSTIGVSLEVASEGSETIFYWICAGERYGEVRQIDRDLIAEGPARSIARTSSFWYAWVNRAAEDLGGIPPEIVELYKRSLLIVRTQCDDNGAILAANDSDIQSFHNDHYSYLWPRDGALVCDAMDRAGFHDLTRSFLLFAEKIIKKEGYFLHKYNPDGSVASSWHPWVRNGKLQLPIQEDETALVVWLLARYYQRTRDLEFVHSVYKRLVASPADFMAQFRDEGTGLPLPTFDLWEERQGVFTFTCLAVWAGLSAAAQLADVFNEQEKRHRYLRAMNEIREGMIKHLWMPDENRFARGLVLEGDELVLDPTIDASMMAGFFFGPFDLGDPMVTATVDAIRERLWVRTPVGGIARYENDGYQRAGDPGDGLPGNPWFICTLWLAGHLIARAESREALAPALDLLRWVHQHARPSLVVAEQIHPTSGHPISVAPLTWSHGEIVSAVRRYLDRLEFFRQAETEKMQTNTLEFATENRVDNP